MLKRCEAISTDAREEERYAREDERYAIYPPKISKVRYLSDAGGRNITFLFDQSHFVFIFDSVPFFRPYMSIKISFFQEYG